jgi:hypothetical protein
MAAEKEPLEAFTAMAAQTADYFGWLQKTTSTFPWSTHHVRFTPESGHWLSAFG